MKQRLHPIELTLMIVAALALTSGAVALHTQSQLAEKVVRLHVLANSDSEEDQALKLKVRDAVLEQATETLRGADSQAEASRRLTDILPELEETARVVITANGYDYGVRAELAESGMTMIVVTHEMRFAREVSSRTIFLDGGVIGEDKPSHELFSHPESPRLVTFLNKVL